MPIDYPSDRGGTAGYVSPVKRKKNKNKKTAKSKADLRSGGMYSSGRAIPPAPGTKKAAAGSPPKKPARPSDKGGRAGYVRPSGSGVARGTYKPGGLYSTGRAIPPSPGTKKRYQGRGRGA